MYQTEVLNMVCGRSVMVLFVLVISGMMFLFSLIPSCIGISPGSDTPGEPDIEIEMDDYEKEVNVAPGETGVLKFNGTVSAVFPPGTPSEVYCIVNLRCECGGWPVSNPPALVLSTEFPSKDFSVTVQVPIETSSKEIGDLVIRARWRYEPGSMYGELDPVHCTIIILPFADIRFSSDELYFERKVGTWVTYHMNVRNEGNYDAIVDIRMEPQESFLSVEPMNARLEVAEGTSRSFSVRVKQREGYSGVHSVVANLNSDVHSEDEPKQLILYLRTSTSLSNIHQERWFLPVVTGSVLVLLVVVVAGYWVRRIVRRGGQ
ncbi:MAG: choice-of-anchor T family protein [Thermoplasmatota archaeon]